MKKIKINKVKINIPTDWSELSPKQILLIIGIIIKTEDNIEKKILALGVFIPKIYYLRLNAEQVLRLFPLVTWAENELNTNNILPKFKGLLGPYNYLEDLSVEEFVRADYHYINYLNTNSQEELDNLVAILYRPKKHFFSKQKAKLQTLLPHLKKVKKLAFQFKIYVFLFFTACKKQIIEDYQYLYDTSTSQETQEQEALKKHIPQGDWNNILLEIAEKQTFGNFKELTEDTIIHNALAYINKKNKDYITQKENAETA